MANTIILEIFAPQPALVLELMGPDGTVDTSLPENPAAAAAAIVAPQGSIPRFVHTQSSASALWTVNHNLGDRPAAVAVLTAGGVEMDADVRHVSVNQLTVGFASAITGSVLIN